MSKIVVLIEKYCDLNKNLGVTSAHSNVIGSLLSAEIDHSVYHYDSYLYDNNNPIDDFVIETVKNEHPNCVFCSYYPFEDERNIKIETFEKIRNLGVPVVFIWFDFGHKQIRDLAFKVGRQVGNLNVIVDTFDCTEGNFIPLWVPQDERIFYPRDKEIDVSFVGTKHGYETRRIYLEFLSNNYPIYVSGGQREQKLDIKEYAEILGKSKITLNFPDKPDGTIQAKCRIYEAMLSGALLLEKSNNAIAKWFNPMEHYVPFDSQDDLLDKIKHYLINIDEKDKIVNNALHKMKIDYSSKKWWSTILEKL